MFFAKYIISSSVNLLSKSWIMNDLTLFSYVIRILKQL